MSEKEKMLPGAQDVGGAPYGKRAVYGIPIENLWNSGFGGLRGCEAAFLTTIYWTINSKRSVHIFLSILQYSMIDFIMKNQNIDFHDLENFWMS